MKLHISSFASLALELERRNQSPLWKSLFQLLPRDQRAVQTEPTLYSERETAVRNRHRRVRGFHLAPSHQIGSHNQSWVLSENRRAMSRAMRLDTLGRSVPGEESRLIVRGLDQEQIDVLAPAPAQQREPDQLAIIELVHP